MVLLHYKVRPVLRMACKHYCHKMNFKFWNHSRFDVGVINVVGHQPPAICHPLHDKKIVFANLTIISILSGKSTFIPGVCMDMFWFAAIVSITTLFNLMLFLRRCVWTENISMRWPNIKTDVSVFGADCSVAKKVHDWWYQFVEPGNKQNITDSWCATK